MSKLCVHAISISLDGHGAGPNRDWRNPLGVGGMAHSKWLVAAAMFRKMFGQEGGETAVDNGFAARGIENIGA